MLNALCSVCLARPKARRRDSRRHCYNSLTRAPVDLALALFRTCVVDGCKPSADTRRAPAKRREAFCQKMCLHALSSFQRTGCHPDSAPLAVVGGPLRPYSINSSSTRPLQGNLSRLLPSSWSVNPNSSSRRCGCRQIRSEGPPSLFTGTPCGVPFWSTGTPCGVPSGRAGAQPANLAILGPASSLVNPPSGERPLDPHYVILLLPLSKHEQTTLDGVPRIQPSSLVTDSPVIDVHATTADEPRGFALRRS